jgi:serine/threonine protein kinase
MEIANASGTIVDTRYQLVEHLGEGGSGSTYSAVRLEDGAIVALKILSLRHLNDWKQLELFEREAKVLAQLNHPQIPNYLEYFHVDTPTNRAFYIVQQLAPGKPLTAWVQSGWRGTEAEVRDIASQLLEILAYLHQQSPPLIHRDLKPHNIIRNDDGRVFLVDFGAVQDVYNNTLLKGSTVAGTFGYMAPEQFRGLAVPASDLYGLGATILYLLTHRSPADLPQERLKLSFRTHVNIGNHFADWLETVLEPDLSDRFPSAAAALTALQKPNRFRSQRGTKVGFPWRGATIAATILAIFVPLIYEYRYAFITRFGFPARHICDAIGRNDVKSLQQYLDRGVSINANVGIGYQASSSGSLLHCAIDRGQVEIVKYLLDNGADIDSFSSSSNGFTPLHQAIKASCPKVRINNLVIDCDRQLQILLYLLDRKANINLKDRDGLTPLMSAVEDQNDRAVEYLLKYGANPHPSIENKSSLWHILVTSNVGSHTKNTSIASIAQQLILAKIDVNKADNRGDTPLHLASKRKDVEARIIEILLANGARTDLRNNQGETPLISAISISKFETIELLLSRNSEVNISDKDGKTPLVRAIDAAARDGYMDTFTPDTFTSYAMPPLDKDLLSPKIVQLLLTKGADPNLVDRDGNTALHLLGNLDEVTYDCRQKRSIAIQILDLLIQHQADIKAVNKNGDTALHILSRKDFFPIAARLIGYGGNPLQQNRQGKNALELIDAAPSRSSRCEPEPIEPNIGK